MEHDALDRLYDALKKGNADISIGRHNSYDETHDVYMTYVTEPEDTYWTWKVLLRTSKIVYLNRCVYWYRVGLTATLSNKWSEKRLYDEIEAREEKNRYFSEFRL